MGRGVGEQPDTTVALVKAHVPRVDILKPQRRYTRNMCSFFTCVINANWGIEVWLHLFVTSKLGQRE